MKVKFIRIKAEDIPTFNTIKAELLTKNPTDKVTDEYVIKFLLDNYGGKN